MAEVLLRIADTQFWVLADTVTETILQVYKKSQVEADILAIQKTLLSYPDETVMEQDVQSIIYLIKNYQGATQEQKDRVIALVKAMWTAYQQDPLMFDAAQLRDKLERLQDLLARMV